MDFVTGGVDDLADEIRAILPEAPEEIDLNMKADGNDGPNLNGYDYL